MNNNETENKVNQVNPDSSDVTNNANTTALVGNETDDDEFDPATTNPADIVIDEENLTDEEIIELKMKKYKAIMAHQKMLRGNSSRLLILQIVLFVFTGLLSHGTIIAFELTESVSLFSTVLWTSIGMFLVFDHSSTIGTSKAVSRLLMPFSMMFISITLVVMTNFDLLALIMVPFLYVTAINYWVAPGFKGKFHKRFLYKRGLVLSVLGTFALYSPKLNFGFLHFLIIFIMFGGLTVARVMRNQEKVKEESERRLEQESLYEMQSEEIKAEQKRLEKSAQEKVRNSLKDKFKLTDDQIFLVKNGGRVLLTLLFNIGLWWILSTLFSTKINELLPQLDINVIKFLIYFLIFATSLSSLITTSKKDQWRFIIYSAKDFARISSIAIFVTLAMIDLSNIHIQKYNLFIGETTVFFVGVMAFLKSIGKVRLSSEFSYKVVCFTSFIVLAGLFAIEQTNIDWVDKTGGIAASIIPTIFLIAAAIGSHTLYYMIATFDVEDQYPLNAVIKIQTVVLSLSFILFFITITFSSDLMGIVNSVMGNTLTFTIPTFESHILVIVLTSLIFIRIRTDYFYVKASLIAVKWIAITVIFFMVSNAVKEIMLDATSAKAILGYGVLTAVYTTYNIGRSTSESSIKFSLLVIKGLAFFLFFEIVFYIMNVANTSVGLKPVGYYRWWYAIYFGFLGFAYLYIRNIKLSKRNQFSSVMRFATSAAISGILFISMGANTTPSLNSQWLKEKLVEAIINSGMADQIDPGILEDILGGIDWDKLPPDFDYNDLKNLPTFVKLTKNTDSVTFLKEYTSYEYSYTKGATDGGWSFKNDDVKLNDTTGTDHTANAGVSKQFEAIDTFFKGQGVNNWSEVHNVSMEVVNSYKMNENILPSFSLKKDLRTTESVQISSHVNSSLKTNEPRVGTYSFDGRTIDFSNPAVINALNLAYTNNTYANTQDVNKALVSPVSLNATVKPIADKIKQENNLDNSNDFVKLYAIADYIAANYEIDMFSIWYRNPNLDTFLSTNKGTVGDAVTLFTYVAREMNIPVRAMKGYMASGTSYEIKKEVNLPSIEINIPGVTWADGSYFLVKMIGSNINKIPGGEGEVLENPIFNATTNGDTEIFLRETVSSGFSTTDKSNLLEFTNNSAACNDALQPHSTPYGSLTGTYGLGGLDFSDVGGTIVKTSFNSVLYGPYYTTAVFTDPNNPQAFRPCTESDRQTHLMYGNNVETAGYAYVAKQLNWTNKTRTAIRNSFDNVTDWGQPGMEISVSGVITASAKEIYDGVKGQLTDENDFTKLYLINGYISNNITIDNNVKTSYVESFKEKKMTQGQVQTLYLAVLREANIRSRLAKGYYVTGTAQTEVRSGDAALTLEVFVPNAKVWINAPKELDAFTPVDNDVIIEAGDGVVQNGEDYTAPDIFEGQSVNFCDTNLINFKDPKTNQPIPYDANNIRVSRNQEANPQHQEGDQSLITGCTWRFWTPNTYNIRYSITLPSGRTKVVNMTQIVKVANPEFRINEDYNLEAIGAKWIPSTDGSLPNTIHAIMNQPINLCNVFDIFDILDATRNNQAPYAREVTQNSGMFGGGNCNVTSNRPQTIDYNFFYASVFPNVSARRETRQTLKVVFFSDVPDVEISQPGTTANPYEVWEEEDVNLATWVINKTYSNGVPIPDSAVGFNINGTNIANLNHRFRRALYGGIADNGVGNFNATITIDSITGSDRIIPIVIRVKASNPINYRENAQPATTIINGQTLSEAANGRNITNYYAATNPISNNNANLTYAYTYTFTTNTGTVVGPINTADNNVRVGINERDNAISAAWSSATLSVVVTITETNSGRTLTRTLGNTDNITIRPKTPMFTETDALPSKLFFNYEFDICSFVDLKDQFGANRPQTDMWFQIGNGPITRCTDANKNITVTKAAPPAGNILTFKYIFSVTGNNNVGLLNRWSRDFNLDVEDYVDRPTIGTRTLASINDAPVITIDEVSNSEPIKKSVPITTSTPTVKAIDENKIYKEITVNERDGYNGICQELTAKDFDRTSYATRIELVDADGGHIKDVTTNCNATSAINMLGSFPTTAELKGKNSILQHYKYTFTGRNGITSDGFIRINVTEQITAFQSVTDVHATVEGELISLNLNYLGEAEGLQVFGDTFGNNVSHTKVVEFSNEQLAEIKANKYIFRTYIFRVEALNQETTENRSKRFLFQRMVGDPIDQTEVSFCLFNDIFAPTGRTHFTVKIEVKKGDGEMLVYDSCHSAKTTIQTQQLFKNHTFDFKENHVYEFKAYKLVAGIYVASEIKIEAPVSIFAMLGMAGGFIGIIGLAFLILRIRNRERIEVAKKEQEVELSTEETIEWKRIRNEIKNRYKNLITVTRKILIISKKFKRETEQDYARRLLKKDQKINKSRFRELTDLHDRACYFDMSLNPKHLDTFQRFHSRVLKELSDGLDERLMRRLQKHNKY